MQTTQNPPSRSTSGQIDTKISVPQGKEGAGLGLPQTAGDNPVQPGGAGSAVKGFGGGLINPKI